MTTRERDGSVYWVDDFGQVIGWASGHGEKLVWDLGPLREQFDVAPPPREIPTTVRELVRRGRRG